MRLISTVAYLAILALAGCESVESLHSRRHDYRRPDPGEVRPKASLALTEDQLADRAAARRTLPLSRQTAFGTEDRIVFIQGRRPLLPRFETTPVIDIRPGSKTLVRGD